jgi:hypothetical protein
MNVDIDNCSALRGSLIMEDENSDGEHTLKRGDDTWKECQWLAGIDGPTNFRGLRLV